LKYNCHVDARDFPALCPACILGRSWNKFKGIVYKIPRGIPTEYPPAIQHSYGQLLIMSHFHARANKLEHAFKKAILKIFSMGASTGMHDLFDRPHLHFGLDVVLEGASWGN
jgi:hypothetical protein